MLFFGISYSTHKVELVKSSLANRNSFGDKSDLPWTLPPETQS